MPKDSLNIYMTIQDGMSPALASITDKTKALDKETQQLQQTTNAMTKASQSLLEKQVRLQSEYDSSKKKLKDCQKAYDEYQDELTRANLDNAIKQHAELKNELIEVTEQLNANKRAYKENVEEIRKGGLSQTGGAALGGLPAEGGTALAAIWSGLGIGQELSQLAEQAGGALLNSAFGDSMGGVASNALSGAITGASLGTAIAPGLGTAVGAALGGGLSAAGGMVEQWGKQDDAFKDYYGGLYEDVSARSDETVESGSTIAGGREQTRMAFTKRFGSEEDANVYLRKVEKMAAETNYDYDEIVGYTKLLLNSYDPDAVFDVLRSLSDASAGLDLNSSDVNMMISGFSKMKNLGKATQEYLGYYRERGIDTDQALVDYYQGQGKNVEKSDIAGMVKEGNVSGEDASAAILAYIQDTFGGLSNDLAGTYDAMVDNLGDINASLEAKAGDAYNTLRKKGVKAQMDALGGDLGDEIGEINAIKGENRARRENLQEQYYRDVMGMVLHGTQGETWDKLDEKQQNDLTELRQQYAELKERYEASRDENGNATDAEAGEKIEAIFETAEGMAQGYFDNSAEMKQLAEIERDEVAMIRENMVGLTDIVQNIYLQTQELSKGMGSTVSVNVDPLSLVKSAVRADAGDYEGISLLNAGGQGGGDADGAGKALTGSKTGSKSHAFGLNRVPFDDYPALLHEGERVLTAREAREQDRAEEFKLIDLPLREQPPVIAGGDDTPLFKGGSDAPGSSGAPGGAGAPEVNISGNTFVGASEEMADQLWEIIVRKLEREFKAAGR